MSPPRRPLRAVLVAVGLALAGVPAAGLSADGNAPRTLKDLQKRTIEIRPQAADPQTQAKAMENYRRFLELQKTDPKLRAEAMRRLGDLSLESGELERMESEVTRVDLGGAEAIRLYSLLLQAYPDYPRNDQVMYQLARAYETTGQPEKALETLDAIVQRYPGTREIAEVHFRRGELLFSARNYRGAEAAYAQVTGRGPGDFYQQGLYKQGWALFKLGLYEESLPVFGRLLDLKLLDAGAPSGFKPMDSLPRADRELVDDTLRVESVIFSDLDGVEPLNRFIDAQGRPAWSPLLYARLGDLYVEKQRYQDGAGAYRAFVAREPNHEMAPNLAMQAIEAYRKGGFAQLVLEGKQEYVERYNYGTTFWAGRERANYPQVAAELKTNITDLAAYHHATAQKSKKPEDFAQAARWYRMQLASFPDDADAAQVNFRLADVLFEGGQFADAVTEYERSAYAYAIGPDSARAGYAALNAYSKQEERLPAAEKPAWKRRSIESGVRFAQTFPEHPDSAGVLTRATQDLYAAKDLPRAIEVAGLLLARVPPADGAQRRIAWSVTGQSRFDLSEYGAAEAAWTQARLLAASDPAEQKRLTEQIAVAVYRQGEARRAAGDSAGAVDDFLRIAAVAPGTPVVETAQYDAAATLITMKDWPRAIGVLEAFRRDYPASRQQPDVTQKLAVAYMEAGRADAAAGEFERIAATQGMAPALRLEALSLAADQYEKSANTVKTVATLEVLVKDFPTPVAERIETRQKLADYAAKANDRQRQMYWQREIVQADATAGAARTDRTKYLAARSSLALAEPERDVFRGLKLTAPLSKSLAPKRRALDAALNAYRQAAAYNVAEVTTRASYEIAELYRQLGADLMASERPKNLSADELEQYDLLLEEQAIPFEEQAIKAHEANAVRARDGLFDEGVRLSYAALAKLSPARYGKTEQPGDYSAALALAEVPLPVVAPVADPQAAAANPAAAPAVVPAPPPAPALPARAVAQFDRALQQARAGQAQDAELEFKQLVEAVPTAAGAAYNLGVLLRAGGRLDEAEDALDVATQRAPRSAVAFNELGVVRRERGDFAGAAGAYEAALAIDPDMAAAHRNLAVLRDVYLGDPAGALPGFERYQALTGEDRPVASWIADVKQRAGRAAQAPPAQAPAAQAEAVP
jgi:tetratricopeptide (TPR) repeat protein